MAVRLSWFLVVCILLLSSQGCFGANEAAAKLNKPVGDREMTVVFVKPDGFSKGLMGSKIKEIIKREGFRVKGKRQRVLSKDLAEKLYENLADKPFYEEVVTHVTSGPVETFYLERKNAVQHWRAVIGPTDPEEARRTSPNSVRALYGTNITANAVHGSDSIESAAREILLLFPESAYGLGLLDEDIFKKEL